MVKKEIIAKERWGRAPKYLDITKKTRIMVIDDRKKAQILTDTVS